MNLSDFDLYTLFCARGIGNRKINRLLGSGNEQIENLEKIIAKTPGKIVLDLDGFDDRDVESLRSLYLESVREEFELMLESGIGMVTAGSENYPFMLKDRLGIDAPVILFILGKYDIISSPAVAIVGSRHVSNQGEEFAKRLVEGLKETCFSIISGGARGVDMVAHRSAIEYGLDTMVVLAYGINHALTKPENDEVTGNVLFLSQFHPNSGWSPASAMIRNKTVCALSRAIFVIEAGESGGTVNTGETALKMGIPLYVISPDEFKNPPPGNRYLISKGGRELFLDSIQQSLGKIDG